jgi:hypothetical protein
LVVKPRSAKEVLLESYTMKKIILSVAFLGICWLGNQAQAQPGFHVQVNIGAQPAWFPPDYAGTNYYYLPDIQTYYDVHGGQFVYQEGGRWVFGAGLPDRYRSYDLRRGYKVAVNERQPYLHHEIYRERYGRYGNETVRRAPYADGYGGRYRDGRDMRGYGHGHRY